MVGIIFKSAMLGSMGPSVADSAMMFLKLMPLE